MKMDAFHISTDGIAPAEKLPYWQAQMSSRLTKIECTSDSAETFSGTMSGNVAQSSTLINVSTSAYAAYRAGQQYTQIGDEYIFIYLQTTGDAIVEQNDRQALLQPGDITMLETSKAFRTVFPKPNAQVILRVPRPILRMHIGNIASFTATIVRNKEPIAQMTREFLTFLASNISRFGEREVNRLTEQAIELLVMAFMSSREQTPPPALKTTLTKSMFAYRGRTFIEANLRSPGLTPTHVAEHLEISKRYLSAIFADDGQSVERYIWKKRLAYCARDLADSGQASRSIGDIAFSWGFSNLAHFSQAFKTAYGQSPREYRTVALRLQHEPSGYFRAVTTSPIDRISHESRSDANTR